MLQSQHISLTSRYRSRLRGKRYRINSVSGVRVATSTCSLPTGVPTSIEPFVKPLNGFELLMAG